MYDGFYPVEHGFLLWPDSVEATWADTGGAIVAKPDGSTNTNAYWYQATYEWADNQGNIFRSAPSIPIPVTTTGSGTAGTITVNVPTLRLTYKTLNLSKIVIYRWSVGQQNYYQVTSLTSATLNSLTTDSIAFVDTLADATILGNSLLYTTGGVLENIAAPASNIMTLFDTRLWVVNAEDGNLLDYSKQVIEATPVEFSDLLTYYVAPNAGTSQSTGPVRALAPMDDKLCLFKKDAIYYINGSGPDNTGANNQYSPTPIFITSSVGSDNQRSLVLIPSGLMFQSDKGIWLLGRDLSTQYIGAGVEAYNNFTVTSAVNVPGTTQVRFTLNNGVTLMYDYYYNEWGIFEGVPAISSCIYQGLHTSINSLGQVFQENPGSYLDGSSPVLMSFETGEYNLASIQGYERFYDLYLVGEYITPFKFNLGIAYNYSRSVAQNILILPTNYTGTAGSDPLVGMTTPVGGPGPLLQWRLNPKQQLCTSFRLIGQEVYDPTYQVTAGAGLTLSSLLAQVGIKKGVRPIRASNQVG